MDDSQDSRKRPLDGDIECGVSKRSNQGMADNVHLKVLIPSIAAGAIIGKGGETIAQLQKETGARVKMSKANDFYPGTNERVCLMTGTLDSVMQVHQFVMDKIREKPDPNPKPVDGELKVNLERHKQVKILVPNSTAGMIIGKGGTYIKQIKDDSGAYVQISQKSKDMNLPERCITIAGEPECNKNAIGLILQKISEDPQSSSCPNISYADVTGPVASSNPTGSPFANGPVSGGGPQRMDTNQGGFNSTNIGNSLNNLTLSNNTGGGQNPALENLKTALRGSGFSEQATEEIAAAMGTLASYGFLGMGLGLGGLANLAAMSQNMGNMGQNMGAGSNANGGYNSQGSGPMGSGMGNQNTSGSSVFGPVGQATAGLINSSTPANPMYNSGSGALGNNSFGGGSIFNDSYTGGTNYGQDYGGSSNTGYGMNMGTTGNQNSFGLGTGIGGFGAGGDASAGEGEGATKKELEVAENIVGVILGPGGKGIVELQQYTGTNIQISKKGVYSPGTRNRIVTVSGGPNAVSRAAVLIQHRIAQEEAKRARQGTM